MNGTDLKVARIGNSRGVRLPAAVLARYCIGNTVRMEERSEGILLRPSGGVVEKLSWEDTAREMAAAREDWRAWDGLAADGLEAVPWESGRALRIAEPPAEYSTGKAKGRRR
jgi:antitoxin MazE